MMHIPEIQIICPKCEIKFWAMVSDFADDDFTTRCFNCGHWITREEIKMAEVK